LKSSPLAPASGQYGNRTFNDETAIRAERRVLASLTGDSL
jgi:hypothetical protein